MEPQMNEDVQGTEIMEVDTGEFHIGHLTFTAGGSLKLHANDKTAEMTSGRCVMCEAECMASTHQSLLENKPNKLYGCSVCHGKFSRKSNLKLHMRLHTIKGEYERKERKVKRQSRKVLKEQKVFKHLLQPQKTETYECWVCREKFPNIAGLIMHLKFHTEEKPYECSLCGVKFVQRAALVLHEKAHTIEKHLACASSMSGNRFKFGRLQNIFSLQFPSKVMKEVTFPEEEMGHECGNCNAKFSSREDLIKHEIEHKDLKHECAMCSEGFHSLERLCIHRELHVDVPLELKDLSLNS